MRNRRQETKKESSTSQMEDSEAPEMDIKSIMKDIEFFGSSHMTWKQKKDLENRKVVSLGGKPPKNQRLPLSVARVQMKKQKEREQKMLQENAILGRFGGYFANGTKKVNDRRRPEDRVLKSTEGNFRNGVLDVKSLLKPSSAPRDTGEIKRPNFGKGKTKKGGKKSGGKKKNGGRKHR